MTHQQIDERSLAFGRAVARRLQERPESRERARATLRRWLASCSSSSRQALLEWQAAVDGPADAVIEVLTGSDERSIRLRQSNPFAGVLSPAERLTILRRFHEHDAPAA